MKVLVTGSSGFVGKAVIQELQGQYELLTPSSQELDLLNPSKLMCECCIDETTMEKLCGLLYRNKVDAIVHLAGNVGGIGYNQNNQGKLGFENLQMGLNVLEGARLAHVQKVIMLGTTCSYPLRPQTIPFVEKELFDGMPESTNSGYGIAKRTLIKLGIEYARQYGMNITNLIPTNMYGPHDHFEEHKSHVIPAMIKKFEETQKHNESLWADDSSWILPVVLWGTGNSSRDFLYVEDCAKAISLALQKETGAEPINLGRGQEVKIWELANIIKDVGEYDVAIEWDKTKPDGQPRRSLDITRAQAILGWQPSMSFEEGLRKTIDWYRQNHV